MEATNETQSEHGHRLGSACSGKLYGLLMIWAYAAPREIYYRDYLPSFSLTRYWVERASGDRFVGIPMYIMKGQLDTEDYDFPQVHQHALDCAAQRGVDLPDESDTLRLVWAYLDAIQAV